MNEDRVSKEVKLLATKDIVANYLRNEKNALSADQVCDLLKKVYGTMNELIPDPEKRTVGLVSN